MKHLSQSCLMKVNWRNPSAGRRTSLSLALVLSVAAIAASGCAADDGEVREDYRDAVVATAAAMGPRAEGTLKAAYAVLDGGESSQEAQDMGGVGVAKGYVARFERIHDYQVMRECVFALLAPGEQAKRAIHESLAASDHYRELIADAERLAPEEYRSTLEGAQAPVSDAVRSSAAVHALLQRGTNDESQSEALSIRAVSYLALGTHGVCPVSENISTYLKSSS